MIQPAATMLTTASAVRGPSIQALGLAVFALPGDAENIGDGAAATDGRQEDGKDGKLLPDPLPLDPWAMLAAFMPVPATPAPVTPTSEAPPLADNATLSLATPTSPTVMPVALPANTPSNIPADAAALPASTRPVQIDPNLSDRITPQAIDPALSIDLRSNGSMVVDAVAPVSPRPHADVQQSVTTPTDDAPSGFVMPTPDRPIGIGTAVPAGVESVGSHRYRNVPFDMSASVRNLRMAVPPEAVSTNGYQRIDMPPTVPSVIEAPVATMLPITWQMSPIVAASPSTIVSPNATASLSLETPTPAVAVRSTEPTVAVRSTEPTVAVRSTEPTVAVRSTEPTVKVAEPPPFLSAAPAPAGVVFGAARIAAGLADQTAETSLPITSDGTTMPVVGIDRIVSVLPVATTLDGLPLDLADHRWPHAMLDRIEMLRDVADTVDTRIRVVPDALGSIEVGVRQDGDTLHVRFTADQPQTRALLQEAQPRLAEAAEQRGLKLGQTSVGAGVDTGTAGQGQHRPPPAPLADPRRPASIIVKTADPSADDDARIA